MKNILNTVKTVVASKAARQILFTKHHSPKILFVAGTVGFVATVALAVRATMKMEQVLDEHEKEYNEIAIQAGHAHAIGADVETVLRTEQKDYRRLQMKTGLQIAKLYALPVGVGALSIACLAGGQMILTKRYGAAMAAYMGLDQAFKQYRQRIVDEYGVDVDHKFAVGASEYVVEEKMADGTIKKTTVLGLGNLSESPYTEVFDERSRFFTKEPLGNSNFLQIRQNWATDKLRAQGHLYLNEVLDLLGLPRTEAGSHVGWVYFHDDERQKRIDAGLPVGDNYVDFGVFLGDPEWVEALLNGNEKYAVLDFNCDGMINHILYGKK